MSQDDSNNAVYVSSNDNYARQDDQFDPLDSIAQQESDNMFQPHTNSSLPSMEQFEVPPEPKLTLFLQNTSLTTSSQMSIEDQKEPPRKQFSIEILSPMKMSPPKKESNQEPSSIKFEPIPEDEPMIRTRRKVSKTNYNVDDSPDEEDNGKPCHCSKTHCLQLYCSCFHNRRQCTAECKCNDCYNDGQHEEEILKAVEQIKMKEQRASHHDLDSFDTKQVWGCKCKKTKCVKGYCECFIRGKKCTSHCQCNDCANKRQVLKKPKINTQVKKKIKKKP